MPWLHPDAGLPVLFQPLRDRLQRGVNRWLYGEEVGQSIRLTMVDELGLVAAVRERAVELGGTCVIERRARGGTRVRAWMPLTQSQEIEVAT